MPWQPSSNPKIQQKWRRRVEVWRSSGLSQAAHSLQHGFSATSLRGWRRWFEQHRPQLPALVELQLAEPVPTPAPTIELDDTMIIELPGARFVHLVPGFDPASVAQLVGVLEAL
jgi:hypothetical protein